MITSITDWVSFLQGSDKIIGLPLLLGGLALMVFGWRLWKGCVAISYGLIGIGGITYLMPNHPQLVFIAIGAGVVLAVVSYWPTNLSLAVLGGLIGGGFMYNTLEGMAFQGTLLHILAGTAAFCAAGFAFINRQMVVIAVTAFEGSVLMISGVVAFLMTMPSLYATFASHREFAVPFGLLVPTVMSCFFQVAEVHRVNKSL